MAKPFRLSLAGLKWVTDATLKGAADPVEGGTRTQAWSRLDIDQLWGVMRAKLFRNGRSQAVRLPAEFRFEGTEVEVHRDPESGAVVLTPVRPSARALLDQRDALLKEPGFQAELEAFFEGLRDTRPAEPVEFP